MSQPLKESTQQDQDTSNSSGVKYAWFVTLTACLAFALVSFDNTLIGIALPMVLDEFNISVSTSGYLLTATYLVGWLFTTLAGPIMDRKGRKVGLNFALIGAAVFSGLTAFVQNTWQLFIVRILSGGTGAVESSASAVIVSEIAPKKLRGIMMALQMAGYPVGAALAGTLGALILPYGWRALFLVAFIPAAFVLWIRRFVKEPDRFLEAQKVKSGQVQETKYRINTEEAKKMEWSQVFAPGLRKQTWLLTLACFFSNMGIIVMSFYTVYFLNEARRFSMVEASSVAAVGMWLGAIGYLIIGKLSDHFASRNLMIIYLFLGTAGAFLFTYVHGSLIMMMIFCGLYQMFGMGIWGVFNRYTSESFPTRIRATGVTTVFGASWLGHAAGPLVGSLLMEKVSMESAFLMVALTTLLTAILLMFAKKIPPNTDLEDIIN